MTPTTMTGDARGWIVLLKDKDLPGEPDVGIAVVLGDEQDAARAVDRVEREACDAGRARCVGRHLQIDLGRLYRIGALLSVDRVERGG